MKTIIVLLALIAAAGSAGAAFTPYVHGGLGDLGTGDWTFHRGRTAEIVTPEYTHTFYVGGGFNYNLAQWRQRRVIHALAFETDGGFTYHKQELWVYFQDETVELWEQSLFQFTFAENFVFRLKIPVQTMLLTPFLGIGGGVAIIPSSIRRLHVADGGYEASAVGLRPVYEIPFGLELTLTPNHTIYGRFGPVAPTGATTFSYTNAAHNNEELSISWPNTFMVAFGYRAGL
jgi:hypothetical protein